MMILDHYPLEPIFHLMMVGVVLGHLLVSKTLVPTFVGDHEVRWRMRWNLGHDELRQPDNAM